MPITRPRRPAVLVGLQHPTSVSDGTDAFKPDSRLGQRILVIAGRGAYPSESILITEVPKNVHDGKNVNVVRLSEEARRLAKEHAPRDFAVIGRELGEAFGVPRSVPVATWWPSWVLGPDRLVLVLPDPRNGGAAQTKIAPIVRSILDELWQEPA